MKEQRDKLLVSGTIASIKQGSFPEGGYSSRTSIMKCDYL